jgi:hypothetical protein
VHWRPIGERDSPTGAYDELYAGVPEWLRASLREWVEAHLTYSVKTGLGPKLEHDTELLRLIERKCRFPLSGSDGSQPA